MTIHKARIWFSLYKGHIAITMGDWTEEEVRQLVTYRTVGKIQSMEVDIYDKPKVEPSGAQNVSEGNEIG